MSRLRTKKRNVNVEAWTAATINQITNVAEALEKRQKGAGLSLEEDILKVIAIDIDRARQKQIFEELRDNAVAAINRGEENDEALLKKLEQMDGANLSADDAACRKTRHFEHFKRSIEEARGDNDGGFVEQGDGELQVARKELVVTCPLTRAPFVDPVKHVPCGHTFTRDVLLKHYNAQAAKLGKTKVKCPVGGCSHFLQIAKLEMDKDMEYAMSRHAEKQKKKKRLLKSQATQL